MSLFAGWMACGAFYTATETVALLGRPALFEMLCLGCAGIGASAGALGGLLCW